MELKTEKQTELMRMTPRKIAVELFKLPSEKRADRLNAIQYPDRWQVEQYLENFARQARMRKPGGTNHPWAVAPACKRKRG